MQFNNRAVCLEGPNGAGKSTVFDLLDEALSCDFSQILLYHDPPVDCSVGSFVMDKWKKSINLSDEVFHLLFAAASIKTQHDFEAWESTNANGIIISDRSAYSTYAYLSTINVGHFFHVHSEYRFPRLVFYFEIDPRLALQRIIDRDGRTVDSRLHLHNFQTVADRYREVLSFAEAQGSHVVNLQVNSSSTPKELAGRVRSEIKMRMA